MVVVRRPSDVDACSPHKFTQHQMFAILVLREFLKRDYRGVIERLAERSDLREALGLDELPHCSTLCYAEKRLARKGASTGFWTVRFNSLDPSD